MSKQEKLIIILNESAVSSIIKDIGTFCLFAGLMYFNHKVLNGSVIIDVIMLIIGVLMLIGRNSSRVFSGSKQDAIRWLEREK